MSQIPSARQRFEEGSNNKINPYFQGVLSEDDQNILIGYDSAIDSFNNLFCNLDVYEDEIARVLGEDFLKSVDIDIINGMSPYPCEEDNIPFDINNPNTDKVNKNYKDIRDISDEELSKMSSSTKILLLMNNLINHWLEMDRDELNASMIDDMDEEEHKENINIVSQIHK